MLWFRAPEKVYFKRGSLRLALEELGEKEYGKKRAFVVTDEYLYNSGMVKEVTKVLDAMNVTHMEFFDVTPDPTLACARAGAELMQKFKPDVIVALGGGSPMDAAKIMWVLYEHPEADFRISPCGLWISARECILSPAWETRRCLWRCPPPRARAAR